MSNLIRGYEPQKRRGVKERGEKRRDAYPSLILLFRIK